MDQKDLTPDFDVVRWPAAIDEAEESTEEEWPEMLDPYNLIGKTE